MSDLSSFTQTVLKFKTALLLWTIFVNLRKSDENQSSNCGLIGYEIWWSDKEQPVSKVQQPQNKDPNWATDVTCLRLTASSLLWFKFRSSSRVLLSNVISKNGESRVHIPMQLNRLVGLWLAICFLAGAHLVWLASLKEIF